MTNKEYADSLRLIADFFDTHTEFSPPTGAEKIEDCHVYSKHQLSALARALGDCEKQFDVDFKGAFALVHKFGSIEYRSVQTRETVCKRVVVAVKHVEKLVIPQTVIEAHDEEVIEWDCGSILEGEEGEEHREHA